MNEKDTKQRERATHVGIVESFLNTRLNSSLTIMRFLGQPDRIKFIFAANPVSLYIPVESMAYLVRDEKGWKIPNTTVFFSHVDGEMFERKEDCHFIPVYLDIESVVEL